MIFLAIVSVVMLFVACLAAHNAYLWKAFAEQRFVMQQENIIAMSDEYNELYARTVVAEAALESAGWQRCEGPAGWKPPIGPMPELRDMYAYPEECEKIAERLMADGFYEAGVLMRKRVQP